MELDDIQRRFRHHPPIGLDVGRHERVRKLLEEVAVEFDGLLPDSREKSLAFTALEECMFWMNTGIEREGVT